MTGYLKRAAVGAGLCAVAFAAPALAQDEMTFEVGTEFRLQMGDYVLPEGSYRLEQADFDNEVFILYDAKDVAEGEPIAMINAWRVPGPDDLDEPRFETEARFSVTRARLAGGLPVLRGWTVEGERWRIRDVVEADEENPALDWAVN